MYTLQKACEAVVRIVWGTWEAVWGTCEVSACVHIWITPSPFPVKLFKNPCKSNASHASPSCQRWKYFDTWVWILGGGTYVHITKSMWGHCEEHVKRCEEHVGWVLVYTFESPPLPCLWNWLKIPASQMQATQVRLVRGESLLIPGCGF